MGAYRRICVIWQQITERLSTGSGTWPDIAKPVWAFVELGHPYPENSWPSIQPSQVIAAVWQSLIAGARGIIYFNHSFGGPCVTDNVLRDQCYARVRAVVTQLDREIHALAPVLNAPFADGVVTASPGVNFSTKWYKRHFYVLAGSDNPNAQEVTFSMPCVGSAAVTVLNEHRTIQASGGTFSDYFANGDAIHIYRIDKGADVAAPSEGRSGYRRFRSCFPGDDDDKPGVRQGPGRLLPAQPSRARPGRRRRRPQPVRQSRCGCGSRNG